MLPPDASHLDPVFAAAVDGLAALNASERAHREELDRLTMARVTPESPADIVARLRAAVAHEPQFNAAALPPHTAGEPTADEREAAHARAVAVVRKFDWSGR